MGTPLRCHVRKEATVIRVTLETLVMGNIPGASVLILRPVARDGRQDRVLPICIGPVEAAAIGKALSGEASARPMTHSLLGTVMGTLGGTLQRVVISRVKGTVFYATLHIKQGDGSFKVDARPSDAVALAVRLKAPMYVTDAVMDSASFPSWVNTKRDQEKAEIEEFHDFVENLTPEDFVIGDTSK